jgi:hypothetical protein
MAIVILEAHRDLGEMLDRVYGTLGAVHVRHLLVDGCHFGTYGVRKSTSSFLFMRTVGQSLY